jgi:Ni2+-binding GTPase involved in maturation of urease and hydrogenase
VDFDMQKAVDNLKKENPKSIVISVSAKTQEGFDALYELFEKELNAKKKNTC